MKSLFIRYGSVMASLALTLGIASAGATCGTAWTHQPKMPKEMDRFRR